MRKNIDKESLIIFAFVISCLALSPYAAKVYSQNSHGPRVRFNIKVYEVDLMSGTAQVNISLTFLDLSVKDVQSEEPVMAIISGEGYYVEIICNSQVHGIFTGDSGTIPWL